MNLFLYCLIISYLVTAVMTAPILNGTSSQLRKRSITRYDSQVYSAPSGKVFSLYHTNWATYGRNFQVDDLPIDYLTDISYAFVKLVQTGNSWAIQSTDTYSDFDKNFEGWGPSNTLPFNGNLGEFYKLKSEGKKFNLILSVGGWTLSDSFSTAMSTSVGRTTLVQSIIDFFNSYPIFVGISIDWEYLSNDGVNYGNGGNAASPNDVVNFEQFLTLLRQAFQSNNMGHYKIALCAAAAPEKVKFDVLTIGSLIDELHLMTYDFATSAWGPGVTTHHTNLYPASYTTYSAAGAVEYYLAQGMPANKIMIGAAYYSRGFANTNGLGQPGSGTVTVMSWETGVADYKSLPRDGFTEYWDQTCQATYAYNPSTKEFLSYDSVASMQAKCDYVFSKGLKGIIAWESAGDFPVSNARSLNNVVYKNFGSPQQASDYTGSSTVSAATTTAIKTPVATSTATSTVPTFTSKQTTQSVVSTTVTKTSVLASTTTSTAPTQSPSGATTWAANTYYPTGTVVLYNGLSYVCRQAHTSLIGWEPSTTPSLWLATTVPVNSAVPTSTSTLLKPTTSSSLPTTTKTTTSSLIPTTTPKTTPSSTTTAKTTSTTTSSSTTATPTPSSNSWAANVYYNIGSVVTFNGNTYTCLQAHTSLLGWEPTNTPALWSPVGLAVSNPTKTVAIATTSSTAAPSATATAPATSVSVPAWAANTNYQVDSLVSYNGATFKCLQAHKSLLGWEPSNTPALWNRI